MTARERVIKRIEHLSDADILQLEQQLDVMEGKALVHRRYSPEKIAELDRRHAEGYRKQPVEAGEFDGFEALRDWDE